eukprot:m51a1_g7737 hypothetical protein (800) ;mRNA; f:179806-198508
MLVAECDTNLHDTPHSLYGVLAVLLPEATSLANGIEVYCKKERKPVWVYANLDLLIADSQEWWHFASVNPPSGNSNFCCTSCLASLDDFAKACTTGKRDYKLAKEAVLEARNVAHDQKAVEAILAKHHLHACTLYNPLFTWPGMDNLFEIITPDPLHLVLFYFKGLVKDLLQGLPVSYRETLEQRITVANEFLSDLMKVPSLKCRKNWRGHEGRNFGLLAPYLLEGLTSVAVLDLWTLVATMFSMVYFPGRTEGSALALGVVAHKAIAAILETYKNKQGKVRHQLNLHSPLHLSFFVKKIGPASLFDTERAENAQAKVAEISEQTSYKMQQYALRNTSCFQLLSIHSMVEDVGSKDYELFHRAAGDAAHMYRTTVHQVDMEVEDEGGEKKIECLWVLDGIPLQQGTVVCTLGDTAAKVSPPVHLSDFDRGFYEYCEPPGGSLCQSPFEWARSQSHADQLLGKIEFSKVHCCPIVLPRFKDITAKLSNKISVVVPTRAEAALEKQQMYVDHCLKIAQAFYNYIEKGLHYSNWAEFETCIKEICKQSHLKKITSEQYKNTAGNVEEQFNSKKMNLQTFQESIKLSTGIEIEVGQQQDQIIKGLEAARAKLKEKITMYKKEQVRVTNELHEQHVLVATLKSQNEGLKEQLELLKSEHANWREYESLKGTSTTPSKHTFGCLYSPDVPVFRRSESWGYAFTPSLEHLSIISASAYAQPPTERDPGTGNDVLTGKTGRGMLRKAANVLAVACEHGHDAVVLSAWGCGAYGYPASASARSMAEAVRAFFARVPGCLRWRSMSEGA